jgi:hypothetical protein
MKKIFLIISLLFSFAAFGQSTGKVSQTVTSYFPLPKVDRRIELLSIVFRMAGNMEYNDEIFKSYTSEIHKHFDKFSDHELIRFTREIRDKNWIGFDAVMKMAIYLDQPPALSPIVPFTADIPDRRWGQENANKFLRLLQQFYTDAKCDDFFNAHKDLYRLSEERYKNVYGAIDLKWFTTYYGTEPKGSFNIIPGLGNGGGNYGVKAVLPDGKEAMYAIMQTSSIDSTNIPVYDVSFNLPTLIHEFNHSYINDIQKKYEKDLKTSGLKLYGVVGDAMRGQAYTDWLSMLNEALIRASVVRYLIDHNSDITIAKKQLMSEYGRGFFWIKDLVDCLGVYEKNRDKYPTLESYMPLIISFYNGVAGKIDLMFDIKK